MSVSQSTHQNRLAHETSPYLLQHKTNPVDWWPWGPAALDEAKRSNKPILLSVGYAACHWCHVMAHESFEDEATAAVMNELFVNIKVDREERPDIDQIYMSALHLLGERGGWPMTMFLTPDGEPFWGGTYFPNVSRFGRPGFVDVLRNVSRIFHEEPQNVEQNRAALMARLAESARPSGKVTIGTAELDRAAAQIGGMIDPVHGGLRGAPKFPQAMMLEFLWRAGRAHRRAALFRSRRAARSSTSARAASMIIWAAASRAIRSTSAGWCRTSRRCSTTMRCCSSSWGSPISAPAASCSAPAPAKPSTGSAREMTTEGGAFCASLDADSEGEEGKFYVWSLAEITDVLGPQDAEFFAAHYDVTPGGNFEGHNILNRLNDLPRNMEDEAALAPLRQKLLSARAKRVRPGLDDKVLADWNGLMVAGLVNAGLAFEEPSWIQIAARAFLFVDAKMGRGDRLGHSWRDGRLLFPGLASDHAAMIRAALALHEATGESGYLERALDWQAGLDRHYANPQTGGYFLTADDAEGLVVRPNSTADEATPNPNAVAAQNLVRLAFLSGQDAWRTLADKLFDGLLPIANENLFMHVALHQCARSAAARGRDRGGGIGPAGRRTGGRRPQGPLPRPHRVARRERPQSLPGHHPAQDKIRATPGIAAFVCVGETCSLPVTSGEQLAQTLAAMRVGQTAG